MLFILDGQIGVVKKAILNMLIEEEINLWGYNKRSSPDFVF